MSASTTDHSTADSPSLAPLPRRRFQFSLGTMLMVSLIVSALVAVLTLGEQAMPGMFCVLLVALLIRATRRRAAVDPPTSFWQRQFTGRFTPRQIVFDALFGFLLPVFCLWGDTVVFREGMPIRSVPEYDIFSGRAKTVPKPLLAKHAQFFYVATAVQLSLLLLWLLLRQRAGWLAPLLGGGMISGSVVALQLGLFLLPFATVGLMLMLTGALGYTPLLSSFVFYRHGTLAVQQSLTRFSRLTTFAIGIAGAASVAIPWYIYYVAIPSCIFWRGP